MSGSGLIFAAFSLLASSVNISAVYRKMTLPKPSIQKKQYIQASPNLPYRVPTPWHLAEKAKVSLTVISPMCRSCWLM